MSNASLQLWEYHETDLPKMAAPAPLEAAAPAPLPAPGFTEAEVRARIEQALQGAEQRWAAAAEENVVRQREQMQATLQAFARERARYFRDAEAEVVHLALAIARKILGREASLDPELLAALVRMSLERMGTAKAVTIHVPPADLILWQHTQAFAGSPVEYELEADPALAPGDCLVNTDLGKAQFGLDTQFKAIEEGMLDLLRLRPSPQTYDTATRTPPAPRGN